MSPLTALAAALVVLFWGSAFTGIAVALDDFGPLELACVRFVVASAVMLAVAAAVRLPFPPRGTRLRALGLGFCGITVYHVALNAGQQTVPAGTTALIVQTVPVFTAVLSTLVGAEQLSRRVWTGVGVGLAGAILIVLAGGREVGFAGGALLIMLAAFATSVMYVYSRPLIAEHGAIAVSVWTMVAGTLPMLVAAPSALAQWRAASTESHVAAVYIGVFPAAVAYLLYNRLIRDVGPARATSIIYLVPLVAIAVAWAWYGTLPTLGSLAGGALAIAGVVLVHTGRARLSGAGGTPSAHAATPASPPAAR